MGYESLAGMRPGTHFASLARGVGPAGVGPSTTMNFNMPGRLPFSRSVGMGNDAPASPHPVVPRVSPTLVATARPTHVPMLSPEERAAEQEWRRLWHEHSRRAQRLRREWEPWGAPVYGAYGFYAATALQLVRPRGAISGKLIFTSIGVGAPLLGAYLSKRWRDDNIGKAAGAAVGVAVVGTLYSLLMKMGDGSW